jgi:hypothetical protein
MLASNHRMDLSGLGPADILGRGSPSLAPQVMRGR